LRVAIQCMLQDIPQELSTEAQTLANKVTTSFPPIEHQGVSGGLEELCPACGVEVPLTDIAVAVCSNGHKWCESLMIPDTPRRHADSSLIPRRAVSAMPSSSARCSVTSFILSTTMVRTCVGCARKAFLPTTRPLYQQDQRGELIQGEGVTERTVTSTVGESGVESTGTTGRGWVVQELLTAVRRCLFCGNNFTVLI
jgi:general transcription factor 3C protein 4